MQYFIGVNGYGWNEAQTSHSLSLYSGKIFSSSLVYRLLSFSLVVVRTAKLVSSGHHKSRPWVRQRWLGYYSNLLPYIRLYPELKSRWRAKELTQEEEKNRMDPLSLPLSLSSAVSFFLFSPAFYFVLTHLEETEKATPITKRITNWGKKEAETEPGQWDEEFLSLSLSLSLVELSWRFSYFLWMK